MVACNAPGANGANHAWRGAATSYSNAPQPESYDVFDDCRGGEKGLVARSKAGGSGRAGFLTGAAWEFDAPAGTVISRITVWRFGFKFRTNSQDPSGPGDPDEGDPWFVGAQEANGNTVGGAFGETCKNPVGQPVCGFGSDGGLSAANERSYDVSTRKLSWVVVCAVLEGCDRFYGDGTTLFSLAGVELYGARVTLTDDSAPSLSASGPALAGGWHRPGESITVDASDNSGIRNARAEAGGAGTGGARPCDFTRPVPCANLTGGSLELPAAPDGEHAVRIVAEDAAGNAATAERSVLIDGTPPQARLDAPRGRMLRVKVDDAASGVAGGEISAGGRALATTLKGGYLRARLPGARRRARRADVRVTVRDQAGNQAAGAPARIAVTSARIGRRTRAVRGARVRVPYGRRAVLRGRLTLPSGRGVAGATLRVVSRVRRRGAPLVDVATVTTDRRGRFSAPVPRGPSRTVGLRFAGGGELLRGSRGIGVRVPAATTIRASRTALRGPGRVGFSGRLRTGGEAIPDRGLLVVLQGRADGAWQTFADTRTDRRGRWRAGYRFRGIGGTYPVRARIRRQAGYPYELGHSRRVTVRVW